MLAMAVSRFASLLDGLYSGWLDDPDFKLARSAGWICAGC